MPEFSDYVCNSRGEVRLNMVRGVVNFDRDDDIDYLKTLYKEWVLHDEFMVLKRTEEMPGYYKEEYEVAKCVKRGNDCYQKKISYRLKNAAGGLNVKVDMNRGIKRTNALYLTNTYDSKLCLKSAAWKNIGEEWNRFLSSLKKEFALPYHCPICKKDYKTQSGFKHHLEKCFSNCNNHDYYEPKIILEWQKNDGMIKIIRSWESYELGYPHIHSLIVFNSKNFLIKKHKDKDDKESWRLVDRNILKKIKGFWHSYVDIQGVVDVDSAIDNVTWYITKNNVSDRDYKDIDNWCEKDLLTSVCCWFFQKNSFSVSGDFNESILHGLGFQTTNVVQTDLVGNKAVVTYEFLGLIPGDKCKIDSAEWYKSYDERPEWIKDVRMPGLSFGSGVPGDWFNS